MKYDNAVDMVRMMEDYYKAQATRPELAHSAAMGGMSVALEVLFKDYSIDKIASKFPHIFLNREVKGIDIDTTV